MDRMAAKDPPPLPEAFAVGATVAARSKQALARGEFRVLLEGIGGPPGARLLGRFCHADETLRRHVEEHLRAEEALDPDAVFAEIVHLPQGRLGNILQRPVLRRYEIPYLGRSGAPPDRQIPITDLMLSVAGDQIVLRSARLGRRIVPCLTTAHNTEDQGLYKFLAALQTQGMATGLPWDWGPLADAPFLPRVVTGRLVLARARWRGDKAELRQLGGATPAARFRAVQRWRVARRLPRWVVVADNDNTLPVDLDNTLCVDSFVSLVKDRDEAVLEELFPAPDALCAEGPEGRFVHQLIIPFINGSPRQPSRGPAEAKASPHLLASQRAGLDPAPPPTGDVGNVGAGLMPARPAPMRPEFRRLFPPGSEWLYVKLYTGSATADQVLCEVVAPVVRHALKRGAADRWFFVRYGDPDWHVRLRLHGEPGALQRRVWPALRKAAGPHLEDGRIWRLTLDTYAREVERYGGPEGIEPAEALFHADSEAVLEILELLEPGDAGLDERWRLTLRGMDRLLEDLGFGPAAKAAMAGAARDALVKEFTVDGPLKGQLGDRFRAHRAGLDQLLDPRRDGNSPLAPGLEAFRRRSGRLQPAAAALQELDRAGRLAPPLLAIAPSFLHMHANRLVRSAQREHEFVLYDFLARLYTARMHRSPAQRQSSK